MNNLLQTKISSQSQADLDAKREATAKLIAANKAKAAAILRSALAQLEASTPSITQVKKEIR